MRVETIAKNGRRSMRQFLRVSPLPNGSYQDFQQYGQTSHIQSNLKCAFPPSSSLMQRMLVKTELLHYAQHSWYKESWEDSSQVLDSKRRRRNTTLELTQIEFTLPELKI